MTAVKTTSSGGNGGKRNHKGNSNGGGGSGGSSNPGSDARGPHPDHSNVQPDNAATHAIQFFVQRGLSANAAAGIVGNLLAESGLNTHAIGDSGTSLGIAQWHEGRKDQLLSWAGANGKDPYALDTQLGFLWHELNGNYSHVLDGLQNTHNAYHATELFMKGFESPSDQSDAAVQGRFQLTEQARAGHAATSSGGSGGTSSGGTGGDGGGTGGNGGNGGGAYARHQQDLKDTNYGYVQKFLEAHPEVQKLVNQAEDEHWTDARLAYEIQDTDWWKNHDAAQRKWGLMLAERPDDAKTAIFKARETLQQMAGTAGVQLSKQELDDLALKSARNQWSTVEIQYALGRHFDMPGRGEALTGAASATADQLTSMAADYGIHVDADQKERWIKRTLEGRMDPGTMEDFFREQAKVLYPSAAKLLETQSLRDVLTPYLGIASNELGIPSSQMMLTDPKWTKALSGENGMMTPDEWQTVLRTDKRFGWDNTAASRQAATDLRSGLMAAMGVRG